MNKNSRCLFVSDLHGKQELYLKLFRNIQIRQPGIVFIGGDIMPPLLVTGRTGHTDFINDFLKKSMQDLRLLLGQQYPSVYIIMGNDDPRSSETTLLDSGAGGLWNYINMQTRVNGDFMIAGYNFVPPTPFQSKDWERYDVSRYIDPGCVSPEHGYRTIPVSDFEMKWTTIKEDLDSLSQNIPMEKAVFLFHSPPYNTGLDKADIEGHCIDHAPVDPHVGSIAVQRLIENFQPLLTLHGHVHESSRLTGKWQVTTGRTYSVNAAHDGPELSLVSFDLNNLKDTLQRELI